MGVHPHTSCVSAGALAVYLVGVGSKEREGEMAYWAFTWACVHRRYLSWYPAGRSALRGGCSWKGYSPASRLPLCFVSDELGRARVLGRGRGLAVRVVVYTHIPRRRSERRSRVGVRVHREAGLAFALGARLGVQVGSQLREVSAGWGTHLGPLLIPMPHCRCRVLFSMHGGHAGDMAVVR